MREKLLLFVSVIYLLILGPELVRTRTATLVSNGFQGVLVSISSDIKAPDQATIDNYVSNIANLINNASLELYNATGNRAYFSQVNIMLPSSWTGNTDDQTMAFDQSRYQKSDIRVDVPNVAYGDMPYVQQSRGCGEPGDFIHITPNFLLGRTAQYGAVGRILAREWIKYYFGVFDEQGYDYSLMYPPKYFTSSDNVEITSCSNAPVNYRTNTCGGDSSVAGIPKSCQLEVDQNVPQTNIITSSILAFPIIPVATKVCNSSNHNSNAPNKQNAMCDGKSVLDVILSNDQFKNNQNTPSTMAFKPTITTSQIGPNTRMALYVVFDNLDSDRNYYSLGPAISKFIKIDLPLQSYFGFTTSENSTTAKTFKQIVADSDRDDVISEIQPSKSTISSGDIVAAVQTAVNNLKTLDVNAFYSTILIVTNATDSSKWSSICGLANENNYDIHLITYASSTVTSYVNAKCEGSQIIIKSSDEYLWTDADVKYCFQLLQERQQADRFIRNLPSVVLPSIYSSPKVYLDKMFYNAANVSFNIEDSSGYSIDTDFYVETCQNLHTPHEYNNLVKCGVGSKKCTSEPASTSTTCLNMNITNSISWTFDCKEGFTDYIVPYVATAIGKSLTKSGGSDVPKESIQLYSWVSSNYDATKKYTKVRIFANLKKSTTPVLNARVVAMVTSETSTNLTIIMLRDDGSGNPDITANDGVYSAYFTQFGYSSAYSVTVKADDNFVASVPTKQYPWITHIDDMGLVRTEKFSRESLAGTFVGNSTVKGVDNIEPGRILDLRVQSASGSTVTLVWTAPGNDLDYGTADKYYLKCSTTKTDVSQTNFGTNDQSSSVPVNKPSNASTLESVTIEGSIDGLVHYCAIRACDAKLQWGTPSNVVSYMMVDTGLSTATTTAIALGVVFGIIALILIIVLIWYCCFRKPKPAKEANGTDVNNKLRPISGGSVKSAYDPVPQVDLEANKQSVKYVLSNPPPKDNHEYGQMQTTRPQSNLSNTSADNYSKNTTMAQEPKSASPKPKPFNYQNVDLPMPKMYGPNGDSSSDDDDVVAESANVAVPQLLTKTAVIENTKMYQSSPQAPPKPLPKPEIYNKILPTNYNRSGYPSPPSSVSSRSAQV